MSVYGLLEADLDQSKKCVCISSPSVMDEVSQPSSVQQKKKLFKQPDILK